MQENNLYCECCGIVLDHEDDATETVDGPVCEDCAASYYSKCAGCLELCPEVDLIPIDHGRQYACETCANETYFHCDECGQYFSRYYVWWSAGPVICDRCSEYYEVCEDCRDVFPTSYMSLINDCYYCEDCAPDHYTAINSYWYKPCVIFYDTGREELPEALEIYRGKLGYGLELEIDKGYEREECAREILEAAQDRLYPKDDGSLSSDGFEIVTHPCTLDYHASRFPWGRISDIARKYSYRSHDTTTCGLHIHASRGYFGENKIMQDLNIAKCIILFDRYWDDLIVPFSRRDPSKLREWATKPDADITPEDCREEIIDKATSTRTKADTKRSIFRTRAR